MLSGPVAVTGHRADLAAAAVGGATDAVVCPVVDGGVVDHVDDGHGEVDAHGVYVGKPEKPEEYHLEMISGMSS